MTGLFARTLVVLFVTLGILVPQGLGAAAAFGLADGRVMVICTGDGLRTLRIAEDGMPADLSETADHCALVHAAGTAAEAAPQIAARTLIWPTAAALPQPSRHTGLVYSPALARAPPAI